jgi:hypothetical protein
MTPIAFAPGSRRHREGGGSVPLLLQHSDCPDSGRRGQGNLNVCGHHCKAQQYRLLDCRTCNDRVSGRKGTPLYRSGLPPEKALALVEHRADRTRLGRYRPHGKDYERSTASSGAMIYIAMIHIMLRLLARPKP